MLLLDTHFLLWILVGASRLEEFPWLVDHQPWAVSPVSLLEIQFLAEAGRLEVDSAALVAAIGQDARFVTDDLSLSVVIDQALPFPWTRDPFDRLLVGHSVARRLPLCTVDRLIRRYHPYLPDPLRPTRP